MIKYNEKDDINYRYALDSTYDNPYSEAELSEIRTSGKSKEVIICKLLKLAHNESSSPYDAIDSDGKNVEIKSEIPRKYDDRIDRCSGKMTFGYETKLSVEKFHNDDPIIVLSGWTKSGRLAYVLSFDLSDSMIYEKIKPFVDMKETGRNLATTPKTTWLDFQYSKNIKILYLNNKYDKIFSQPFLAFLQNSKNHNKLFG